jgi:hypothetical protein
MLSQLRAEALALIDATPDCILSTIGPAGVQTSAAHASQTGWPTAVPRNN